MTARPVTSVAVVALCLCLALAGLPAVGVAGDNVAVFELEPGETDVQPGETVEIEVAMQSHGAYGDARVASITTRIEYPAEHATVVDVEPHDWFADAPEGTDEGEGPEDPEITTAVRTNESAGAVTIEQGLADPHEGVTGYARVATVTLAVAEDADPATLVVTADESDVLLTSRNPQPVDAAPAEVDVAGGGDRVEPGAADDGGAPDEGSDGVGVTTAEEANRTVEVDDGEEDADDEQDEGDSATDDDRTAGDEADAVPGFGIAAAVAVVLATAVVLGRSRV